MPLFKASVATSQLLLFCRDLRGTVTDAVVVANVDDALALAALHPERTLVTTDGVVVRGAVVEASGTEVPGEGLFIVRRDLRNLGGERAGIAAKRAEAEAEIGTLAEQVGTFAATLDAALAASRAAGAVPLTASTWNVPLATRASGRLVSCTRRQVDGSTHNAPCRR